MTRPVILYESRLDDAVPLASTTAAPTAEARFDVLNLRDWRSYSFWRPAALPATVTVDSGAAAAADYLLVWGHDLGTQGATLALRRSTDNFAANDVLVASSTPADDRPFALFFASESFRYWRLAITGPAAPTLAIAAFGQRLEMPASLDSGFDPTKREPQGRLSRSVAGHALGRAVEFEAWSETLKFPLLSWDFLRDAWLPAWRAHLRDNPFVLAWDRTGRPGELHLVSASGGFDSPHKPGQIADLSLRVEGLAL